MRVAIPMLLLLILFPTRAGAQPALDQLWPNDDGRSWTYDGVYEDIIDPATNFTARLIFDGSGIMAPGVEVQNLIGQVDGMPAKMTTGAPEGLSPLLARLWVSRPELRDAIVARAEKRAIDFWPILVLGPADLAREVGHRQTADRIGAWRGVIADWAWLYLTDALSPGAEFTLQLVPDLADDVFLFGTVRGVSESVSTGAGNWANAVVVDYVVDQGEGSIADETGALIGTATAETRGWVAFVPDVGPVAASETFEYLSVDCPDGCDEEALVGQTLAQAELSLRTAPVTTEGRSWGNLKSGW